MKYELNRDIKTPLSLIIRSKRFQPPFRERVCHQQPQNAACALTAVWADAATHIARDAWSHRLIMRPRRVLYVEKVDHSWAGPGDNDPDSNN